MNTNRYGWKPDLPDHRDLKFCESFRSLAATAITHVDLSSELTPCFDQGNLGSCTANAGGALAQFLMKKMGLTVYMPSRLAIYYWERVIEKSVKEDSGATIRDCMKVLSGIGVPHENLWYYNPAKFAVKPNKKVVADANKHKVGQYLSINQKLDEMKQCLVLGFPFMFGFAVYESFESQQVAMTGMLPMPSTTEQMLGGHAVLVVGFDDRTKRFKVRNSWGTDWGVNGYFFMPYDYILNPDLADDFWSAHTIV